MKILVALGVAAFIFPLTVIAVGGLYILLGVWMGRQETGAIDALAMVGICIAAACFCRFVYRRAIAGR